MKHLMVDLATLPVYGYSIYVSLDCFGVCALVTTTKKSLPFLQSNKFIASRLLHYHKHQECSHMLAIILSHRVAAPDGQPSHRNNKLLLP